MIYDSILLTPSQSKPHFLNHQVWQRCLTLVTSVVHLTEQKAASLTSPKTSKRYHVTLKKNKKGKCKKL